MIVMGFMNFDSFFYAKNDLHFLTLSKIIQNKKIHYHYELYPIKDELNSHNQSFYYEDKKPFLFQENDEILLCNLGKKIILFKNYTQNFDNFKVAKMKHFFLVGFLLLMSVLFAYFFKINDFGILYLLLLCCSLVLLVLSLINLGLLFKQIRILKSLSKEEVKKFLLSKM